jgi:rod shape-determining protein MreC
VLRIPLSPLQKAYALVTGKVGGYFTDIGSLREARDENLRLKEQIRNLETQELEMAELKRQNAEFRNLLNFKEQYANFGFLGSTIIGKDPGNWFDVFTIDRGVKDGLRAGEGYPVISADGLVGRVSNVTLLSSDVISIIDLDSTVSVRVARTRDLLVVRGDIVLKQEGLCRVDYIPPNADLMAGDVLETSGMGDVYPKGIRVGTIERIVRNKGQYDAYAIMKPSVDFMRLEEVEVLTRPGGPP